MPQIVEGPLPFAPHRCVISSRDDGELLDFGDATVNEPVFRLYLQRGLIEEAARLCCGMVSGVEVAEVRRQMADLSHKLDEVLDEVQLTKDFEEKFGKSLEAGTTASYRPPPDLPEEASQPGLEAIALAELKETGEEGA